MSAGARFLRMLQQARPSTPKKVKKKVNAKLNQDSKRAESISERLMTLAHPEKGL